MYGQVVEGLYDCKSEVIGPGAYRFKAEIGTPRPLFLIFMLFILMFSVYNIELRKLPILC